MCVVVHCRATGIKPNIRIMHGLEFFFFARERVVNVECHELIILQYIK